MSAPTVPSTRERQRLLAALRDGQRYIAGLEHEDEDAAAAIRALGAYERSIYRDAVLDCAREAEEMAKAADLGSEINEAEGLRALARKLREEAK